MAIWPPTRKSQPRAKPAAQKNARRSENSDGRLYQENSGLKAGQRIAPPRAAVSRNRNVLIEFAVPKDDDLEIL